MRGASLNRLQQISDMRSVAQRQGWRVNSFEDFTHAFIVRFWLEPREIEDNMPIWRGMIKHVPSGRRIYIKNFREIIPFIESHLESAGVNLLEREA
jgi:hypothetical protein